MHQRFVSDTVNGVKTYFTRSEVIAVCFFLGFFLGGGFRLPSVRCTNMCMVLLPCGSGRQTGTEEGNTLAPDDGSVGLPWPLGSPMRLGLRNDVSYKLWAGGLSLCSGYRSVLVLFGCNSIAIGAPLALEPRVRGPSVTCPELLVAVSNSKHSLLKVSGCGFLHYQPEQASADPWALSLLGMH